LFLEKKNKGKMNKKERWFIYLFFMLIYFILTIFSYLMGVQWWIDSLTAMFLCTVIFLVNRWLKLEKLGFTLFNIALLTHNMGAFGFYNWTWGIFAYDSIVHLVSSTVAAYILFNFIARKLHIKKNQRVKHTVIDEHKVILFFLVIASVAMLGVVVELVEYLGFMYFGPGEGILFVGAGDSGGGDEVAGQYLDTMDDIVVNTIGSIMGVLIYYNVKYKKKPWLKY